MRIESKVSKIIYVSCLTIFLTGLGSWVVLAHQDAPAQPKADMADAHFAKAAAQQANIVLPTTVSSKDQQIYDRLARLNGSDFDRAYAGDMVQDHEKDLNEFQNEANNGKNSSIRAFAAQTVPMIQQHLNQAREMQKAVSETSNNRRVTTHATGR
jgi:predicted outer membrane protein